MEYLSYDVLGRRGSHQYNHGQGDDGHREQESSNDERRESKGKETDLLLSSSYDAVECDATSTGCYIKSERDRAVKQSNSYSSEQREREQEQEAGSSSGSNTSSRLRIQAHHLYNHKRHQQQQKQQQHRHQRMQILEPRQMYTLTLSDNDGNAYTTATVRVQSRAPLSSSSLQSRDPSNTNSFATTSSQVRRTPLAQAPPNPYTITPTNENPSNANSPPPQVSNESIITLSNDVPTDSSTIPGEEAAPSTPGSGSSPTTTRKHRTKHTKSTISTSSITSSRHRHSNTETHVSHTSSTRSRTRSRTSSSPSRTRSRTRIQTQTRTRIRTTGDANSPPMAITTNIVHVCVARPTITSNNNDHDADSAGLGSTFTTTSTNVGAGGVPTNNAIVSNGPTGSRDDGRTSQGRITVLTVTDFNCADLPSTSPTSGSPGSDTLPTSSGSNGSDNTTTTSSGNGIGSGGHNPSNPDMASFFATPGGKGTIAGITLGSAAVVVGVIFFFFIWRKKRSADEDRATGGRVQDRDSGSSFGDSTNSFDATGFPFSPPTDSPRVVGGSNSSREYQHHHMPENMTQIDKGPPGSFFVKRNSILLPGGAGRQQAPALDAAASGSAVSPLDMLEHQPQAYAVGARARMGDPKQAMYMHPSTSQDGGAGSSSGEDVHTSSSGHGHDPLRDPSSPGHSGFSNSYNNVPDSTGYPMAVGKHERRKSGYTVDTYRKRRSRPLSVRNPDSDETRTDMAEALQTPTPPQLSSSNPAYSVDNAAVPSSTGLEYYLGSQVATPQVKTDIGVGIGIIPPTVPPSPERSADALNQYYVQNTGPPTTNARAGPSHPRWSPWQDPSSFEQSRKSLYHGENAVAPVPSPSTQTSHAAGYNPYAGIVAAALNPQTITQAPEYQPHPDTQQQQQQQRLAYQRLPPFAAGVTDARSRLRAPSHSSAHMSQEDLQTHRPSIASSDGASSRSSLWRAWENNNRSWVNDGNETPHDVQDVQLGGGNNTSLSGYFSFR